MLRKLTQGFLPVLLAVASPLAAQRELHWKELAVHARLASDGTLAISEVQRMVFTGDWNGGERVFRFGLGQQLLVDGLFRFDPASTSWRKLRKGSLDQVDHWGFTDAHTLRWRSRLPSDPPFRRTEIDYRIDYRLTGILKDRDRGDWRLDHDFVFPARVGAIDRFTLDLELAPEWTAPPTLPRHLQSGPLAPGESQVVTADLTFIGAGAPAHAGPFRLPRQLRVLFLAVAALGALFWMALAVRGERALGRLVALPPIDGIDRSWLDQHVLALSPEEVGAAWDDKVGAAEVAAMLARLQLEGKLSSRIKETGRLVKRDALHMTLLADRESLSPAERKLVNGFFFSGNDTDSESLRKHYKTSGFDPAEKIRAALLGQLRHRSDFATTRPRPSRKPATLLVVAGLLTLVVDFRLHPGNPTGAFLFAMLLLAWIPTSVGAFQLRDRVDRFTGPAVAIAIGLALGLLDLALFATLPTLTVLALVAATLFFLGLTRAASTAMQSREGAPAIARRRELARARRWFAAELAKEKPALEDTWLPYVIGFGLATQMDRWFRAFGGAAAATAMASRGSGGSWSGSASSGGGWTGGGGSFGGAGATASWTAAATAMSSGIAAASSGGGGGGGGGSSGGGGGGGW
jgi:hypothetical protein